MFQKLATQRSRSVSRSNRRLKKQRQQSRSRRLGVEALEPRQMLCATMIDFDSLPPGLAQEASRVHSDSESSSRKVRALVARFIMVSIPVSLRSV